MTAIEASPPIRPTVLLIEDDIDTRDMYRMSLEFEGFIVVDADTAESAILHATELLPDLIVTDIGLSGAVGGIRIAERLKANPRTAGIPVLAVTGHDLRTLGRSADLFADVLLKPVLPDALGERIRHALQKSHELRSRSRKARHDIPRLLARSQEIVARSAAARQALGRDCPRCGKPLQWKHRQRVHGVIIDDYEACAGGCGRFIYDHRQQMMLAMTDDDA